MLICNNCGITNAPGVRVCEHCRMQGGFQNSPNETNADSGQSERTQQCINCGSQVGISLLRCPDCRFPMKFPGSTSARPAARTFVIGNLKAG